MLNKISRLLSRGRQIQDESVKVGFEENSGLAVVLPTDYIEEAIAAVVNGK